MKIDKDFWNLLNYCKESLNSDRNENSSTSIMTVLYFLLSYKNSLIRKTLVNFMTEEDLKNLKTSLKTRKRGKVNVDMFLEVVTAKNNKNSTMTLKEKKNKFLEQVEVLKMVHPEMSRDDILRDLANRSSFTGITLNEEEQFLVDYELAYAFYEMKQRLGKTVEIYCLSDLEYALLSLKVPSLEEIFEEVIGDERDVDRYIQKNDGLNFNNLIITENNARKETKPIEIPEEIQGFLTNLNERFEFGKDCEICGRDKEIYQIWMRASKREKPNSVLVGPAGVGKTAIIEKITWQIVNEKCPKRFKGYTVLELSVNNMIAGTQYRGMAEQRMKDVIEFLQNTPNIILFIDELHMIIGAGNTSGKETAGFDEALKPLLARGDARVIGATTDEEYEKYFSNKGALKRRFEKVSVMEPNNDEVYPMIKKKIEALEKFHGVSISKEMVDFIILYASFLQNETRNPDRTIDAIDNIMVSATFLGKTVVDKECVDKTFEKYFNNFKHMSKKNKKAVAAHEIGHYILWRDCKKKDKELIGVSIVPGESYLGCNVFRRISNGDGVIMKDKDFYIHEIAELLAGRLSEKLFTDSISSGAESDLKKATLIAQKVITEYGMGKRIGVDRVYFETSQTKMYEPELIRRLNEDIDDIISEAKTLAEKVLNDNKELIVKIVDELVEKGILDKEQIAKIENDNKNNELFF